MAIYEFEAGQLRVSELIGLLKTMPQDAPVWHEGCDCYGVADGVKIIDENDSQYVLITRNN